MISERSASEAMARSYNVQRDMVAALLFFLGLMFDEQVRVF